MFVSAKSVSSLKILSFGFLLSAEENACLLINYFARLTLLTLINLIMKGLRGSILIGALSVVAAFSNCDKPSGVTGFENVAGSENRAPNDSDVSSVSILSVPVLDNIQDHFHHRFAAELSSVSIRTYSEDTQRMKSYRYIVDSILAGVRCEVV